MTVVKERPILFSTPMVRALLDGRKTMTRRVVKPQPVNDNGGLGLPRYWANTEAVFRSGAWMAPECRFKAGERLWVRETFGYHGCSKAYGCVRYRADNFWHHCLSNDADEPAKLGSKCRHNNEGWADPKKVQWRSPIHMPRWASRITLEITGVKVERLQDIDDWGAIAEGIDEPDWHKSYGNSDGDFIEPEGVAVEAFRELWDEIHGPDSWSANPWVWVISFRMIEKKVH